MENSMPFDIDWIREHPEEFQAMMEEYMTRYFQGLKEVEILEEQFKLDL